MKRVIAALSLLLLGGCASVKTEPFTSVTADFQAAAANFTAAGMTAEATCMNDALAKLNAQSGQSFTVNGVVSLGSVGYITLSQVQNQLAQGPNALSPACLQVVGKVHMAALNQLIKAAPNAVAGF